MHELALLASYASFRFAQFTSFESNAAMNFKGGPHQPLFRGFLLKLIVMWEKALEPIIRTVFHFAGNFDHEGAGISPFACLHRIRRDPTWRQRCAWAAPFLLVLF